MVGRLGSVIAPIINLSGRLVESFLHLVQGPFGVIAFGESFPEVILFFLKQLRIAGNSSPSIQASGGLPILAIAHLPPGEGSNFLLGVVHLPSEDVSSFQATPLQLHRERNSSPQLPRSTWVVQGHTPPGQAGKAIGTPTQAYTAFPGGQCNLQGKQPHPHTPQ